MRALILSFSLLALAACGGSGGGSQNPSTPPTSNTPPNFTSESSISVNEGLIDTGYIASATDPDGDAISYRLFDGPDSNLFNISATTGRLSFRQAPDFEVPRDRNPDNVYEIIIRASDGNAYSDINVSVSILDVVETEGLQSFRASLDDETKSIKLEWLTNGITPSSYSLFANYDGSNGFDVISKYRNFSAPDERVVITLPQHLVDFNRASLILEANDSSGMVLASSSPIELTDYLNPVDLIVYGKAPENNFTKDFGYSMSISDDGNTLVIGSRQHNSAARGINPQDNMGSLTGSGAAFIYNRIGTEWKLDSYLKAPNSGVNDQFGFEVALSGDGNTLAVTAKREDSSGQGVFTQALDNDDAMNSGAVYIYKKINGQWSFNSFIKASNSDISDFFGQRVKLSFDGMRMAVSATGEATSNAGVNPQENNDSQSAGAVYIYDFINNAWQESAFIKPSNPDSEDFFGTGLALSSDGNRLVVGSPDESSSSRGINQAENDNSASDSGAIYVFDWENGWAQTAYIKASNADAGDFFGTYVDISSDGNLIVVGAYHEDNSDNSINSSTEHDNSATDSGAAYVYKLDNDWKQVAYIKADNAESMDNFGRRVVISGNGDYIAVAALDEGNLTPGVQYIANMPIQEQFGHYDGAVYIYKVNDSPSDFSVSKLSYVKAKNPGQSDSFGVGIDISFNGETLVIGAPFEDSNGIGINNSALDDDSKLSTGAFYIH